MKAKKQDAFFQELFNDIYKSCIGGRLVLCTENEKNVAIFDFEKTKGRWGKMSDAMKHHQVSEKTITRRRVKGTIKTRPYGAKFEYWLD